jgi:hypothetical protein
VRVIFERIDDSRYRIGVLRDGRFDVGADIPLRSAPGGGSVPHDIVHFAVEEQAGLQLGVFGQVAAGGDVGGFFRPVPADRRPARDRKRSKRIGAAGRADTALSERLAGLAARGRIHDAADLDPRLREAINRRLADLLAQWSEVPAGERLVLTWPEGLTVRRGRPARRDT